ncbi:MAG: MATE family efflux transporter, partial [Solobacterium sp.]|nr:MATE family efflux transporter [Solobacterium sp.]
MNTQLAEKIRNAEQLTFSDKIKLIRDLSIPGILAVITETVMGFIDTAMVGALGALASASIGLVMSSTWLFGELINSVSIGFSVQVAHAVGAGKLDRSRRIFKGSILTSLLISFLIAGICYVWAHVAPSWLQAQPEIWKDAIDYLGLYAIFLPIRQLNYLVNGMLQCAGDMKTPSKMAVLMCILDIIFNFILIFPSRLISIFGIEIWVYGAN